MESGTEHLWFNKNLTVFQYGRGIFLLKLSVLSPRHAGQAACASRRQNIEAHFARSCKNIWSGNRPLPLCLRQPLPPHSHPGRGSGGKAQGSESGEGKITGLLQTARRLAGKGAADSSLEKRSCMRVRQTRGRVPPFPHASPACFAFISTPPHFSQLHSPFCAARASGPEP